MKYTVYTVYQCYLLNYLSGRRFSLKKTIAIVSLSSGILGEDSIKHEFKIGLTRLKEYNLHIKIMPNALKGVDYLKSHPEARAEDLLLALQDDTIDFILCAIGGDDTYRLLPYLFDNHELEFAIKRHKPKKFLGFSDTTMNHFMFYKLGVSTFYGQAFLPDVAELESDMLPYTKKYFEEFITTGKIKAVTPSDVWYEERKSFDENEIGKKRVFHINKGFELLQGKNEFCGRILGGCIESMYDLFNNERHTDQPSLCQKYQLFPALSEWQNKILLLETSEEQPTPEKFSKIVNELKNTGIFLKVNGIIFGKPMDERYTEEYKKILVEKIDNPSLSIIANVNVGHALPRCIVPFGIESVVNVEKQIIEFFY